MAPVVFVVHMGVHRRRDAKKIRDDLLEVPDVVEVRVFLTTGHVGIIGMADPATLGELLEDKLDRPVFLLADFGAAPAPPVVGGGGGYGAMPPPWPAASSLFPAPMVGGGGYHPHRHRAMPTPWPAPSAHLPAPPVGGYYNPYVRSNQLRYATPPPQAGYYNTPFGGRPHYMRNDAPTPPTLEDEGHNGCCCSIQ